MKFMWVNLRVPGKQEAKFFFIQSLVYAAIAFLLAFNNVVDPKIGWVIFLGLSLGSATNLFGASLVHDGVKALPFLILVCLTGFLLFDLVWYMLH